MQAVKSRGSYGRRCTSAEPSFKNGTRIGKDYLARPTRTRKQIHEDFRRDADKLCIRKKSEHINKNPADEEDFPKGSIFAGEDKDEKIIAERGKLSGRWKELIRIIPSF